MCMKGVTSRFSKPSSALHKCAIKNDWRGLQSIIAEGHDVEERSGRDLSTALHCASEKGSIDSVRILLAAKAQVDSVDRKGRTPLLIALKACRLDVSRLLVAKGASINVRCPDGWAVLHYVCNLGMVDVLLLMIAKGVDLNCQTTKQLYTGLHIAAACNNKITCEVLLRQGAMPDLLDADRRTPLHRAAVENAVDAAKVLIQYGANLNIHGGNNGRTALQMAASLRFLLKKERDDNLQLIELLIIKGADLNARDRHGHTAIHIALKLKRHQLQELLMKYGAKAPSFMDCMLL